MALFRISEVAAETVDLATEMISLKPRDLLAFGSAVAKLFGNLSRACCRCCSTWSPGPARRGASSSSASPVLCKQPAEPVEFLLSKVLLPLQPDPG